MKVGRLKCLNPKSHRRGVEKLLKLIAQNSGKSREDIVIAYEEDVSVYAVRVWLTRPIPPKHWHLLSEKSGFDLEEIKQIARKHWVGI